MDLVKQPILPEINKKIAQTIRHYDKAIDLKCSVTDTVLKHLIFAQQDTEVDITTEMVYMDIREGEGEKQKTSYHHRPAHQLYEFTIHIIKDFPLHVHMELHVMECFTEYILPVDINEVIERDGDQATLIENLQSALVELTAEVKANQLQEYVHLLPNTKDTWKFITAMSHVDHIYTNVGLVESIRQKDVVQTLKEFLMHRSSDISEGLINQEMTHLLAGALHAGVVEWSDEQFQTLKTFGVIPMDVHTSLAIRSYVDKDELNEAEQVILGEYHPDELHILYITDASLSTATYICYSEEHVTYVSRLTFDEFPHHYTLVAGDIDSLYNGLNTVLRKQFHMNTDDN